MAGWRIRRNDLPEVIRNLSKEMDKAVGDIADDLSTALTDRAWKDTGILRRTIEPNERWDLHAQVQIGIYLGRGFYSGFQEFGTRKQAPRPVVVPTAHEAEPVYASYMTTAVRRACRV